MDKEGAIFLVAFMLACAFAWYLFDSAYAFARDIARLEQERCARVCEGEQPSPRFELSAESLTRLAIIAVLVVAILVAIKAMDRAVESRHYAPRYYLPH
jgi:hypothetical protein